jgi:hypothetical protein
MQIIQDLINQVSLAHVDGSVRPPIDSHTQKIREVTFNRDRKLRLALQLINYFLNLSFIRTGK